MRGCKGGTGSAGDPVDHFLLPVCVYAQIVPGLPKTRSGKIMRRILRKIAADRPEELGDVSTLADPSVVQLILNKHNSIVKHSK